MRPVCLPTKSEGDLALADLPALVLGWGVTRDQVEPQLSRTLQEAQVSGETVASLAVSLQGAGSQSGARTAGSRVSRHLLRRGGR